MKKNRQFITIDPRYGKQIAVDMIICSTHPKIVSDSIASGM